ncbi:family 10 glycosylhydrolase [Paenibacillus larvae]|nr:family 10 glycosylhydrolase [Paenibacillus larvae]MDT2276979.1 family 10 glycosylhydrolase [Paenibacillus larvae]
MPGLTLTGSVPSPVWTSYPANHPARQHPDWVVTYGGRLYFNPGLPEVKQYITNSVLEVVRNYDIDSVHLDDYFYPYPVSGEEFPDDAAFRTYETGSAAKRIGAGTM